MEAIRTAPDTHGRPDLDVDLPGWYDDARCRGTDTRLFFGVKGDKSSTLEAVNVCETCPVVSDCLALAVADPEYDFGVWGGTTPKERKRLRRERGAA